MSSCPTANDEKFRPLLILPSGFCMEPAREGPCHAPRKETFPGTPIRFLGQPPCKSIRLIGPRSASLGEPTTPCIPCVLWTFSSNPCHLVQNPPAFPRGAHHTASPPTTLGGRHSGTWDGSSWACNQELVEKGWGVLWGSFR